MYPQRIKSPDVHLAAGLSSNLLCVALEQLNTVP